MDEHIPTSTPIEPIITPTVPVQKTSYHTKRRAVLILSSILVALIVLGVVWLIIHHHSKKAQLSPQQTLQQLDASSQPVKTTVEQRAAILSKISKTSVHYTTVTTQQELDTLSALQK